MDVQRVLLKSTEAHTLQIAIHVNDPARKRA